jgi:hypothetical protein
MRRQVLATQQLPPGASAFRLPRRLARSASASTTSGTPEPPSLRRQERRSGHSSRGWATRLRPQRSGTSTSLPVRTQTLLEPSNVRGIPTGMTAQDGRSRSQSSGTHEGARRSSSISARCRDILRYRSAISSCCSLMIRWRRTTSSRMATRSRSSSSAVGRPSCTAEGAGFLRGVTSSASRSTSSRFTRTRQRRPCATRLDRTRGCSPVVHRRTPSVVRRTSWLAL